MVLSLPFSFLVTRTAEDLADLVGGQPPEPNLAGAFEDAVNGEVALEDEIAAVLDLVDGVEAAEIHRGALPLGELRAQDQRPVVQALADDLRAEPVGGGLQGRDVIDGQEGVVVLAEADLVPVQFLLDEGVAVEIVGGLEREEGGHAQHHRPQGFIPHVEVVMREAAALLRAECDGWDPGWGTWAWSSGRSAPCSMLWKMK